MHDILIYHHEVYRKLIHISSSSIALLLWYFGKDNFLPWVLVVAIIVPILDFSRKYVNILKNIYFSLFRYVTRSHEYTTLSGASWVFLGIGITVCIFSEKVAIISILVMSLSDSAAAIIGIKFGTTRLFDKSLEGTLSFLITTYMIIFLLSSASIIFSLITSILITIIELFSNKFNDNIIIPIATALILTIGGIN